MVSLFDFIVFTVRGTAGGAYLIIVVGGGLYGRMLLYYSLSKNQGKA